jgi:hypothetical protein
MLPPCAVLLPLLACWALPGVAAPAAAHAASFTVQDLPRVRCVSNYLYGEEAHDVATWRRDLDRMKVMGFNTVWMVNVWADYEPSVEPEQWREDRLGALQGICAAARERGMWVVLPLAYIGEGWGPKGVDAAIWPLIPKHQQQHLAFLRRLAAATASFDNVFYLLCTEEILPGTLLYQPHQRPECVASFRDWARQANPDVAYWNRRWGTAFTWQNLTPADTTERHHWEQWADHQRWFAWLMRRLLPPMVEAIHQGKAGAVVGLHDFLTPLGLDLTAADGALAMPSPFDFYSLGYYYDHGMKGGLEANLAELTRRVEAIRKLYPGVPLFCGELGLDVVKEPPAARAAEEALQTDFLLRATGFLGQQKIGFSLWDWRTVVPAAPRTHSLIREDGTRTSALLRLHEAWQGR